MSTRYPDSAQYSTTGTSGFVWSHDQLVGFWRRFVAAIIDSVLLAIVGVILTILHLSWLTSIVDIAYFVYFWSTTGRTVGNMAMHIRVAKANGDPLTLGTGIIRYVGYIISVIVVFIGLLWVIWDPRKQGWHDHMAGTVVVND